MQEVKKRKQNDKTAEFEQKVQRIKEIVKELGGVDLSLKEGVLLYREGFNTLTEAQTMLRDAQIEYEEIKNQILKDEE